MYLPDRGKDFGMMVDTRCYNLKARFIDFLALNPQYKTMRPPDIDRELAIYKSALRSVVEESPDIIV